MEQFKKNFFTRTNVQMTTLYFKKASVIMYQSFQKTYWHKISYISVLPSISLIKFGWIMRFLFLSYTTSNKHPRAYLLSMNQKLALSSLHYGRAKCSSEPCSSFKLLLHFQSCLIELFPALRLKYLLNLEIGASNAPSFFEFSDISEMSSCIFTAAPVFVLFYVINIARPLWNLSKEIYLFTKLCFLS